MNCSASIARRWDHLNNLNTGYKRALEIVVCANDVVHWVNHWGMTYDPRVTPSTQPFDLFPKQAEFLEWLSERERAGEDGLVEKSRDSGLTWLCCAYALHGWLFREGFSAGFGSRKLDLVDKLGDMDSIFEKLRFLLRNLPTWMLPDGFSWKRDDNYTKLLNRANGASITGEGGDDIGRGGRKTVYFVDESAFLEHPQRVDAALSQTTRCRLDVSTPHGQGGSFYRRRFSGAVPVFTFHWRDDPRKGEAWYAREVKRLGDPVVVAQELDIDYSASIEGVTIPAAWVRAAVDLELEVGEGTEMSAGLDVADEGRNRNVFIVRQGPRVREVRSWSQANTTETAHRAREAMDACGAVTLYYDSIGVGAGVRGALESAENPLTFRAVAVQGGAAPTERRWPSGKTSREMFLNLRAELWWTLRARFEKAYEFREMGIAHPPEEMISIPNDPLLIGDLSQPLYEHTETGKIRLESKEKMAKRDVKSPDFGDALAYAFADGLDGGWAMDRGTLAWLRERHNG